MPETAEVIQFFCQTALLVWRTSKNGSVEQLPEWAALTGQTPEQLAGEGWMDVLHPDDFERVRMAWRTSVMYGSEYNTDYRVRFADGVFRRVNPRGIATLDDDGAVDHWIGAVFPVAAMLRGSARAQLDGRIRLRKDRYTDITPATLRAARGALNLSAAKLAEEAGVSLSTMRRLEEDEREAGKMGPTSIARIVNALSRRGLVLLGERAHVTGIDIASLHERTASASAI